MSVVRAFSKFTCALELLVSPLIVHAQIARDTPATRDLCKLHTSGVDRRSSNSIARSPAKAPSFAPTTTLPAAPNLPTSPSPTPEAEGSKPPHAIGFKHAAHARRCPDVRAPPCPFVPPAPSNVRHATETAPDWFQRPQRSR